MNTTKEAPAVTRRADKYPIISTHVPHSLRDAVRAAARERGTTVSKLLRAAAEEYLATR